MNDVAYRWQRVPIVWLLIALPTASVIAGIIMLSFAVATDDGLVVDDYYRRGKEINLDLARDRAATARGLIADVRLDTARNEIRIRLRSTSPLPSQLEAQFLYSTRQGNDRRLLIPRALDGDYVAPLPSLAVGRYYLRLAADDWRLLTSLNAPNDATVTATHEGGG